MAIMNSALRAATDAYRNPGAGVAPPAVPQRSATHVTTPPQVSGSPGAADPGDWKLYAECGPDDTELFFSKDPMEKRAALAICNDCPVAQECLTEAMAQEKGADLHGRYGIRGGTTPVQRRELSPALSQRPVKPRRARPTTRAG